MKIFLIYIGLMCVAFYQNSLGCALISKSLSKFDDSEYVFIGKIVGYTDPVNFDEKRANNSVEPLSYTNMGQTDKRPRNAVGLIVKVVESVYLPKVPVENFEILPYDLMADCSIRGKSVEDLKRLFPTDSEIRVIAKEAEFVPKSTSKGTIRLEERPSEPNSIITNIDKNGLRMTSSSSVFSYKDYGYDMNSDSDSKYLLPAFEIRKDLLRLKNSKTQTEKDEVLKRLVYAPRHSETDISAIFDKYAENHSKAESFYAERLRLTDPALYNYYQVRKGVLLKLRELGYSNHLSEKAFDMSVSEEMEKQGEGLSEDFMLSLKHDDIVERTLLILRSGKVR